MAPSDPGVADQAAASREAAPESSAPAAESAPSAAAPAPVPDKCKQSSMAARAVALELYNMRTPMHIITQRTGIKPGAFYALMRRATQRGFTRGSAVADEHVADAHRSGRPPQTATRRPGAKRTAAKRATKKAPTSGEAATPQAHEETATAIGPDPGSRESSCKALDPVEALVEHLAADPADD